MKIGIALSGGGIRGIAHAGVLKALETNDIKIDAIGGTSAGSMVATLYAIGYSPYYIYVLFKRYAREIASINSKIIVNGIKEFAFKKEIKLRGLKEGNTLEDAYNNLAEKKGIKTLKDIKMPLVVPAVDLLDAKEYIFTNIIPKGEKNNSRYITDVEIGKAVRASSSFPAVFSPYEFNEHLFMDGGALNNIPADEVRKQGVDKVISVKFQSDPIDKTSNVMDIVMKTIDIMGSKISEKSLERSDYVLDVSTDKTGLLDIEKVDKCYKFGYDAVINKIDEIRESLL